MYGLWGPIVIIMLVGMFMLTYITLAMQAFLIKWLVDLSMQRAL